MAQGCENVGDGIRKRDERGRVVWPRLAELPLVVEACEYDRLHAVLAYEFDRVTTQVRLVGAGADGLGEDVSVHNEDGTSLHESRPPLPLAGEWTLGSFCDARRHARAVAGAAGVGRGAALPHLGVRVGGARPRAAPGRPLAARRPRTGAAAGALRQLARPGRGAFDRAASTGGSPVPRRALQARRARRPGRRRSSTRSRPPAPSTRSTSRASTASRSRIRMRCARSTTTCSRRSRTPTWRTRTTCPGSRSGSGPPRSRVLRRADPQRRGHRRDAACRARGERQAVADRQPAHAVRGLRALRAGAAADVRRRHGRARRRPRADRAARRALPRRRAQRRGAQRLQRGRPAGRPAGQPARAPTHAIGFRWEGGNA